jgi:hypothetical protein
MVSESWSSIHPEPRWYYDLDPAVRLLLSSDGDIGLLAERLLRRRHSGLEGVPEFEVRWSTDEKPSKSEIDLFCASSEAVVVGECKSHADIPTSEQKKKLTGLVRIASVVQATEIVLAAGDDGEWNPALVGLLARRISELEWKSGRPPNLRLITGLRTAEPVDLNVGV